MKTVKKTVAVLCLICLACVISFSANALDDTQTLTVSFGRDGTAVSGTDIRLYRVGTMLSGEIIPEGDFAALRLDYKYGDTQGLSDLALALEAVVGADKIQESYKDITDENGKADFDAAQIPEGAYLVLASTAKLDGTTYIPAPSIVSLPYIENGVKPDTVNLEIKYETVPPEQDGYISRKALKVWTGDNEDMRDAEVTVILLCNGSVYDTQVLSEKNGWSYTWNYLDPDCRWTVAEKEIPVDYWARVSFEGITFVVTNDGKLPTKPLDEESTTEEHPSNSPGGPDYDEPSPPDDNEDEELPYTGTNIRFVPYLAIIGTLLFICGYASFRKGEIADEQ